MKKRFIEYDLPLAEISEQSAREKNIRHGHPSTLHIWWARRPLASSRATAFAALIDDPGPDHPQEREAICKLIEEITPWEAVKDGNSPAIERAQEMIHQQYGQPPRVLDPFAGGGSIPLEALRLGCETYASDYNPVAVFIEKATLEWPQKFGIEVELEHGLAGLADQAGLAGLTDRDPSENPAHQCSLPGDTIKVNLLAYLVEKWANIILEEARADVHYFSRIPNLNRMILDKKELFNEAYEDRLREIVRGEIGVKFTSYLWPDAASLTGDGIPDNRALKLVILHPQDSGAEIPTWIERRGETFRVYKNTLFFALPDTAAFAKLKEDVKTCMALEEIKGEIESGESPILAVKRDEVQRRMHNIARDFSFNVRRMYHTLQVGDRQIDLGQPVAGSETLSSWYWRELEEKEEIATRLHYRMLVNKFMASNETVATQAVLDQFYKDPGLPAPVSTDIVARAIQLGIQEGAFGLAEFQDSEMDLTTFKYREELPLAAISFEPGVYLVSRDQCEALLAQMVTVEEGVEAPPEEVGPGPVMVTPEVTGVQPGVVTPTEQRFKRVRLVVADIPASKIADVNRGILMPISGAVGDFKFTLEIEVSSTEGISQFTLENKIKETIRQIGANLRDETLE